MFKKAISLLLAGTLALSLTACGGGEKKPEESAPAAEGLKGSISVQAETEWIPYYDAAIKRVKEKNPDAEIKIIEKGSFDHINAYEQTDPKNEDLADVFAIPADRVAGFAENENIAAVDSKALFEKVGGWKDFDAFNQGMGGVFKIKDEYFAFPMNIECLLAYKQKANAKAQNVDLTQPIDIGKDTYDKVLVPAFDAWYGVALLNSADINLLKKNDDGSFTSDLTADWKDLPAEKQAVITALFDYWKANADNNTSLFDDKSGYGYTDTAFETGKTGVERLGGPWDYGTIAKAAGEENLEMGSLKDITIAGKPLKHWQGGWGFAINVRDESDEAKMALAHALIAELANPEYFEDFFKITGKIMDQVDPSKYEASSLSDNEKATILGVIASYKESVARPTFVEYGKVWDTWKNAVLSWNSVKPDSAEKAYHELQSSFQAMMAEIKK